jgi:hypothetical protein
MPDTGLTEQVAGSGYQAIIVVGGADPDAEAHATDALVDRPVTAPSQE